MSFKSQWYRTKFAKKRRMGFRGYPVATVAFYGPDDARASKVSVGIIKAESEGVEVLQKWFSDIADVRFEPAITEAIMHFIEHHQVKSVVAMDNIIGCPQEEGPDYATGEQCPRCPFWAIRDRWSGEIIQ